jgi:uncharacterized protein (UPF0332 family)
MGLMATAGIADDASEWEIRNAISRSYYALFHMCHAWLALRNVEIPRGHSVHSKLQETIRMEAGEVHGQRLASFHTLRKDADYKPRMLEAREYKGDLDRFRMRVNDRLDEMKAEFEGYRKRIDEIIERSDGGTTNGDPNAD